MQHSQHQYTRFFSAGGHHSAAVTSEGEVLCWGDNRYGQGDVPADLANIIMVSCGGHHTVALTHDNKVRCWGQNRWEQCSVPADLDDVAAVCAGHQHTAVLTHAGKVVCWGVNEIVCGVPTELEGVV
jgi:alpha-tubulin suppressor-like RCC1 family protein